jgi:hypothetical protein
MGMDKEGAIYWPRNSPDFIQSVLFFDGYVRDKLG